MVVSSYRQERDLGSPLLRARQGLLLRDIMLNDGLMLEGFSRSAVEVAREITRVKKDRTCAYAMCRFGRRGSYVMKEMLFIFKSSKGAYCAVENGIFADIVDVYDKIVTATCEKQLPSEELGEYIRRARLVRDA